MPLFCSEAVESDLRFLGIIVFENKLKPGTAPAIATLRAAHIPTRMVTGDNVRTAISVGRECGMVSQTARVYLPSFLKGEQTARRGAWPALIPITHRQLCHTALDY